MHQQIATSPDGQGPDPDAGRNPHQRLMDRTSALRGAGVSVAGVAPELGSRHLRWAVLEDEMPAAVAALARWKPEIRYAFTKSLSDQAGTLDAMLSSLIDAGYTIESVLVLATDPGDGGVLVSAGIDRKMPWDEWRRLGGWGDEHADFKGI